MMLVRKVVAILGFFFLRGRVDFSSLLEREWGQKQSLKNKVQVASFSSPTDQMSDIYHIHKIRQNGAVAWTPEKTIATIFRTSIIWSQNRSTYPDKCIEL